MTTEWAVVAAAEQFTLDERNSGELTFTVSNPGAAPDTVVFDVAPGEGSQRAWFTVAEPQRVVPGQGSVSFLVRLAVPPGTPPRRYVMTGFAYSANTAPEESSSLSRSSGRVTYDVRAAVPPKRAPWPWLAAAAALVLLVAGVVGWLVTRRGDPPAPPQAREVTLEAESLVPGAVVESTGAVAATVTAQANCCDVTWSGDAQLFFLGRSAGDRVSVTVDLPVDGTWRFSTVRTTSFDYANTIFLVDGRQVGDTFFGFTPTVVKTDWIDVGTVSLSRGPHRVTLVAVSRSQGTNLYFAGVDQLRFTQLVQP